MKICERLQILEVENFTYGFPSSYVRRTAKGQRAVDDDEFIYFFGRNPGNVGRWKLEIQNQNEK